MPLPPGATGTVMTPPAIPLVFVVTVPSATAELPGRDQESMTVVLAG